MNQIQEIILKNKITELTKQKKYVEAEQVCIKLTQTSPNDSQVWFALGQIQQQLGKLQLAANSYLMAGKFKSEMAVQVLQLALDISLQTDLIAEGFMATQELLKYQPESSRVNYLQGYFASRTGQDYMANCFYEKAIKIDPSNPTYRLYYAQVLCHLGRVTEGLEQFELAKSEKANDEPHFRSLFAMNYSHLLDEQRIYQAHLDYGKRLEDRSPDIEPFEPRDSSKRLKIAYVSKDFVRHSVAYFFFSIIKNHNRQNFEVFCYSDTEKADDFTEIIRGQCEHWRESHSWSDDELYQRIRDDKIDILIDLIGLTGTPRVGAYAKKAAPVQMSYLGYANTSGLRRMDYRISDNWADPAGMTEQLHTEKLIRLPGGFLSYTPSTSAPDLVELPALKAGHITFGSFNFFPKITNQVLDTWIKILHKVPDSKLCIKAKYFIEQHNTNQMIAKFEKAGISKERLIFKTKTLTVRSHLECYNQVDIHLDTFPYNGTTTTCEALWQGVPTVTLAGHDHRSRVGNSILHQTGIEEFITANIEDYIAIAATAAKDLKRLSALRKNMRHIMSKSTLMDEKRFIRELEAEYTKVAPSR